MGTNAHSSTVNTVDLDGTRLEIRELTPVPTNHSAAQTGREEVVESPVIVFLHEGLGSVAMWRAWPQQVCDTTGKAGLVYSRRGYGHSASIPNVRARPDPSKPLEGQLPADYLHKEAWQVLPRLLAKLNIKRPILVGHSDGASIALLYAARFSAAACVVMAPHVMVESQSIAAITAARRAYESGDLRARLARFHADVDSAFWQWNDVWLSAAFQHFDIRNDCTRIDCPVLAIQGVDDPYGSQAQVEEIRPQGARIAVHLLEHCGHSPHRDQERHTTQLIRGFVGSLCSADTNPESVQDLRSATS